MTKKRNTIALLLFAAAMAVQAKVELTRLTVEGRTTPLGIDVAQPRLGWQIATDKRNVRQRSYRLVVASTAEKAKALDGDVWSSGRITSDQSQWIELPAGLMRPNREYFWRVQVETNRGTAEWSDTGKWSTGLLSPTQWQGMWIGVDSLMPWDSDARNSRLAARYLRKEFATHGRVVRATAHICGLGTYTLYINGCKVGNDELTPLATDFTKSVVYNTYDVTSMLSGRNAIGVRLNAGRYYAFRQYKGKAPMRNFGQPRLMANLIIEYADGTSETVASDTSWRLCADGPVRKANYYDGETYDATKELGPWTQPGYDDSAWMPARQMDEPGGRLVGNIAPSIHVYATDRPTIVAQDDKRTLLDFGTNGAGRLRINLSGLRGDTVVVRYAETLTGKGSLYTKNLRSAQCRDTIVLSGKPMLWSNDNTYQGFRYAEVTGAAISQGDVVRELLADRMDDCDTGFSIVGTDTAKSNIINQLVANARRGIRSNYKGFPLDCPQRDERMPWLGDRTTGCLGESYLMDNRALYAKWDADICQGQRDNGDISDVSPNYWQLYHGSLTWGGALPFSADMLCRQYGDLRPMTDSYVHIKRFLAYVKDKFGQDGIITKDQYGDWCVPPESPTLIHSKDPQRTTDGQLIATAYYFYLCRLMQRYATLGGDSLDADWFAREAEHTKSAFNRKFLHGGTYSNGTVTANVIPLAMGLVPGDVKAQVEDSLVAKIVVNGTHLSTGVVGVQWLMRYLSDMGRGDLAYTIATNDTYPSWGYMIKHGATTIWELWNGDTANPSMNSGNHVMLLGDLLPWLYERVGGIQPAAPGFKEILLKPDFSIKEIEGAVASHPTPYGLVKSQWRRNGSKIEWNVTVPANTTATVCLPNGKQKRIGSGEYRF